MLDVDADTLRRRLEARPESEWANGANGAEERARALRLHQTRQDLPQQGIVIDATAPIERVVDEILCHIAEPA